MKLNSIILTLLLMLTITTSCSKTKKNIPEFNVPGVKTSISRILISPLAFDGAVVALTGYVKDVSISDDPSEPNLLNLSDGFDNRIIIEFHDEFSAELDEQILVSGMFNRDSLRIIDAKLYKILIEDNTIKPLNN